MIGSTLLSFKDGFCATDYNGNYLREGAVIDRFAGFGSTGDIPVIGDWNGDTKTEIGIYKEGTWYLDMNGNGAWDGTTTDRLVTAFGQPGWTPVIGKWS